MNTERAQVGWRFWIGWVLASTVGLAVGFTIGFAVGLVVDYDVGSVLGIVLGGAVFGAALGTAQWLVLHKRVSLSGWWVLASTVGWAVGLAVGRAVALVVDDAQIFAIVLAVGGASAGIAQWIVLRRHVTQAGWWVLASIVAGGATGGAVDLFKVLEGWPLGIVFLALPVIGAVVLAGYGAITGSIMVWLLRQPAAKELGPPQAAE
jgi:hypothetical protein